MKRINSGQSALIHMPAERNRAAWLSIADFLARQNLRAVLAARGAAAPVGQACAARTGAAAPSAINFGGCVAAVTTPVPDGNHGDNFTPASSQVLA